VQLITNRVAIDYQSRCNRLPIALQLITNRVAIDYQSRCN
jgi:hypothetical protein